MQATVLGAGVVGVCQAWFLARAGWQVTVLDRQPAAAMETSFANGGQISPCHAEPWANPGVFAQMAHWLGRKDAPLLVHWDRWDPAFWAWGARFLRNCVPSRCARNIERALRLALYSRQTLHTLRQQLPLDYDQKTLGILHIYRNPQTFARACRTAAWMQQNGLERRILDVNDACTLEPALESAAATLAGGIHTPGDESGDAHRFTQQLASHAAAAGVTFHYNRTIRGIRCDNGAVVAVMTDEGELPTHTCVVACGSYSPLLLRPLGLHLPIIPAKGYSLTIPVQGTAPQVSLIDDEHKMVYSRLGQRLRVAGTAEFSGYDTSLSPQRWQALRQRAQSLFPTAGDFADPDPQAFNPWCGLRPSTPDGAPILGETPIRGLYLNTGHGTLGWTMACGSGQLVSDMICGTPPAISNDGLTLARFA